MSNQNTQECPICFEVVGEINRTVTECGHVFCTKCLLRSYDLNTACPCCRYVLNEREEEDDYSDDDEYYIEDPVTDDENDWSTIDGDEDDEEDDSDWSTVHDEDEEEAEEEEEDIVVNLYERDFRMMATLIRQSVENRLLEIENNA
jgi:hypothetical protein